MRIIHVPPGHVEIGHAGDQLRTVLGSCVALTLWQPHRHIAAMCHIMLPARHLPPGGRGLDGRFADEAWVMMGIRLAELGISPEACICKVFGGAQVFSHEFANVGIRNLESVRNLLASCGVNVISEHCGGGGYRELRFDVATGHVWVRHRIQRLPPVNREARA